MICTFRFSGFLKLVFILFYVIFFFFLFFFFSAHGCGYYSGRNTVNVYYGRYNNIRSLDMVMKFLQSEISQHISPQGGLILLPPNSDMHWLSDIFWVLILVNVWCSADCQLVLYSVEQLILKDVIFFSFSDLFCYISVDLFCTFDNLNFLKKLITSQKL